MLVILTLAKPCMSIRSCEYLPVRSTRCLSWTVSGPNSHVVCKGERWCCLLRSAVINTSFYYYFFLILKVDSQQMSTVRRRQTEAAPLILTNQGGSIQPGSQAAASRAGGSRGWGAGCAPAPAGLREHGRALANCPFGHLLSHRLPTGILGTHLFTQG